MSNTKTMCKLTKDGLPSAKPKKFRELVAGAKHFCKRCGRVAVDSKNLCKPEKI